MPLNHRLLQEVYYINVAFSNEKFRSVEVVSYAGEYSLIGWDMLKDLIVMIDGPKKKIRIWQE